jgi:hypothetical protein
MSAVCPTPDARHERPHRQTGPVFNAAKALLLNSSHQLAVNDKAGGGIAVIGVKTENVHISLLHNIMDFG